LSYHVYTITGADKDGDFKCLRRYSEFYAVRAVMVTRWPGCYIPALPPKKPMGNKDSLFVEDRTKLLDFFLRNISEIAYLYYSEEF